MNRKSIAGRSGALFSMLAIAVLVIGGVIVIIKTTGDQKEIEDSVDHTTVAAPTIKNEITDPAADTTKVMDKKEEKETEEVPSMIKTVDELGN